MLATPSTTLCAVLHAEASKAQRAGLPLAAIIASLIAVGEELQQRLPTPPQGTQP